MAIHIFADQQPWSPSWQAVPPPAIQIRGVQGRFHEKLNGQYALTPHNGPKPALTYVNPKNNSCVVYGQHESNGKIDFVGWVAGWTRENAPDDFFICAKGKAKHPDEKSPEGNLCWEIIDTEGLFTPAQKMQIIPLKQELDVVIPPNSITVGQFGARTPLGAGTSPAQASIAKQGRNVPNVPNIMNYQSPNAPPGMSTPHFGGPVHHKANDAKPVHSADLMTAAGASGLWTTPWSATQAAVSFHLGSDMNQITWRGKEQQQVVSSKRLFTGSLRAEAPSYIPANVANKDETAVGLAQELIQEAEEHKRGGLSVTTKKASWTLQKDTTGGEPVESPVFRLKSTNGQTSAPMQLIFYPQSVQDHAGYVTVQLSCQQGVRMKFNLSYGQQNSSSKVLMGTKYSMDFKDANWSSEPANHRLMIISLILIDWI